jgi:hypothetical protein
VAVQRHIASRISADIHALTRRMSDASLEVARDLMPSMTAAGRMAALVVEASTALAAFRRLNPQVDDDMRGANTMVVKLSLAHGAAVEYLEQCQRSNRLLRSQSMRNDLRSVAVAGPQMSLSEGD